MKKLIVVAGPTASGKTDLSIKLAQYFRTEIISADSRQIFNELTVGTAKPTVSQLKEVPHHFIDSLSITEDFNAGKFEIQALAKLADLFKTHELVIMTGGSGLYINAVLFGFDDLPVIDQGLREKIKSEFQEKGIVFLQSEIRLLDPAYANMVDMNNPQRIIRALEVCYSTSKPYSSFISKKVKHRDFNFNIYILDWDREVLYSRIDARVEQMVNQGLFEEALALLPFKNKQALQTVGYKEIFKSRDSNISKEKTIELIKQNTRNYAKRQMTWFRSLKEAVFVTPENAFDIIIENESIQDKNSES